MMDESEQQRRNTAEYYEGELMKAFKADTITDYVYDETLDFGVDFVMRFDNGKPEYRAAIATLATGGPGVYLDTYEGCISVVDAGGKTNYFLDCDAKDALDGEYREIFEANMQAIKEARR